jgi:hypothetical protein
MRSGVRRDWEFRRRSGGVKQLSLLRLFPLKISEKCCTIFHSPVRA